MSLMTTAGAMAALFLLLNNPTIVVATNAQSPNRQITSTNTNTDNLSWARESMLTYEPFHFTTTSGSNYTYQLNMLVNGGSNSCDCIGTWWLQGIVNAVPTHSGTHGAFIAEGLIEEWRYIYDADFCRLFPSSPPNINFTNYVTLQEAILNTTSNVTYILSVSDNNANVLYHMSQTCSYTTGGTGYGPVDYYNQVEGIIVGQGGGLHTKFTPLSSTIFYGYFDLVSNYNDMSSSNMTSQAAESSNLYQSPYDYFSESYGTGYLYTVESDENTKTAS